MTIRRSLSGPRSPRVHPRMGLRSAAAATLVVLAVAACSGSSNPPAAQGPTSTSSAPPPSTTSTSPTTTPSQTPTVTRTPFPTTTVAHTEPWTNKDADFGYVLSARAVTGGVEIVFDRATWLLASQVPAWNKANPGHTVVAADDYAIGNVSTKKRTFLVRTGAKIFGSIILSDQPEPMRITAAQLVARMATAPGGEGVTCWLYHQYGGLTGDVVQLEEQYRP